MDPSLIFEPEDMGDYFENNIARSFFARKVGSLWFPREEYIGGKIHGYLVDERGRLQSGAFTLTRNQTWVLLDSFTDCCKTTELTFLINDNFKAVIRLQHGHIDKWILKFRECKSDENR